jgi:hypothetical protein
MKVEGYTVSELMKRLKKKKNAVRQAIHVAGIKPIVSEFLYPIETLEILKNAPPKGRPRKPKDKTKKTT